MIQNYKKSPKSIKKRLTKRKKHCKNRIEETVNDVPGIAGRVDLNSGTLTVYYELDVSDDSFIPRIERLGYIITKAEDVN